MSDKKMKDRRRLIGEEKVTSERKKKESVEKSRDTREKKIMVAGMAEEKR